jgi:hypothetical protein
MEKKINHSTMNKILMILPEATPTKSRRNMR